MKRLRLLIPLIAFIAAICFAPAAWAFCGFYVSKADASLYNQASQVIIARNGDRTVLTMANDYQGEVEDFAMVVPVPVVLEEDQVQVGNPAIIERLDAFSAPRLVEYFDPDPCAPPQFFEDAESGGAQRTNLPLASQARVENDALGVTVESRFSVGEYDIVILSAKESNGLETWLRQNNYRIPQGANRLLRPYIRQKMKFFVAKVNLEKFDASGFQNLRPLQMAFESPRFMLPIRLGMINAKSAQDLLVYILSPSGQAELTNYRTVKIPSDKEIPVFVKNEFDDFYRAMFDTAHNRERQKVAFLEYAWDMASCDPCSADPLSPEELRQAGVFWLNDGGPTPRPGIIAPGRILPSRNNVFVTRLHVRYSRDKFPEDLMFQETSNRQLFQGRYILRNPFTGDTDCAAGKAYRRSLRQRFEQEAQTLARLTNWNIGEIRRKISTIPQPWPSPWRMLWPSRS